MTVEEFFSKYNGHGVDLDGAYGNQCMDLAQAYSLEVVGCSLFAGNAIDQWGHANTEFYTKILNTPADVPQRGDVMLWNIAPFGHIAIFSEGDANQFTSFDQNWPLSVDANGNGTGVAHFQHHDYHGVLGWLRPNKQTVPTPQPNTNPMPAFLFPFKYPNSPKVFGVFLFNSEDELKAVGSDFTHVHNLPLPELIMKSTDPQVFALCPIDSFDLVTPFGIDPNSVQSFEEIDPRALNGTVSALRVQISDLISEVKRLQEAQPVATPVLPTPPADLSAVDQSTIVTFLKWLFSKLSSKTN